MGRFVLFVAAVLLTAPLGAALAQEPEWRQSADFDVLLKPYAFEPETLQLEAGRPVRLRFVNSGQATLNFSPPASSALRGCARRRRGSGEGGTIRLSPGERRTIVPSPLAAATRCAAPISSIGCSA